MEDCLPHFFKCLVLVAAVVGCDRADYFFQHKDVFNLGNLGNEYFAAAEILHLAGVAAVAVDESRSVEIVE